MFRPQLASVVAFALLAAARAGHAEEPEIKYFAEVSVPSLESANDLADAGFDVAGVNRKTAAVGVVVTQAELTRLAAFGWPVTVRTSNTAASAVTALDDYSDPQELSAFMDQVVAAYPNLARKIILSNTLFAGQTQYALQITKDVAADNGRPSFILDAQHHAREVMTPEIARDMIDYLTSRYAFDAQVQRWVDNVNIYVVPSVNPDGGMYVFTNDAMWRKNRHPLCAVDNNRNYPSGWGSCNGSSGECSSETCRGASGGSEPETQGLMQLTSDAHPLFTLSYHSYGEYILYPYGCSDPDELSALDEVGQGLNAILENDAGATGQYRTGPVWRTLYFADGTSIDTQYGLYGAYAYVIEVTSSDFAPSYAVWRDVTVQRQRTAWGYFLDKTLDGAQIRGTVTDAGTGQPLAATVELDEITFTHGESPRHADAKGHYHLLAQSGATYHLSVSLPAYCTVTQEVVVGTGPATVDVALTRPTIPQGVIAAAAGDNAIDVSWQPAANADQYRVLRSLEAGGPYSVIATVPATQLSYHDTPVSGVATYFYVVRAVQGCESGDSSEAQATTTGACFAGPVFAGLASVTSAGSSTCTLNLSWPTGASRCGGNVTYRVYRSATPPVVPSPSSLVASGLSGNSYSDHAALANGASYSYLVRAVDAASGTDDGNGVTVAASPTGQDTVATWSDNAGDSGTAQLTTSPPWSVKSSGGKTGPKVYSTGVYANNLCTALTTPAVTVQSSSSLSFASKYDIETNYDAGVVEVATGPAFNSWARLPVNYPDSLSFTGNACGLPPSGPGTVFSRSIAGASYPASPYTGSLAPYAGQSVKLRWRFTSDSNLTRSGWWVDDIVITNTLVPGICSAGAAPNPGEPSAAGTMSASRASSGTGVVVTYTPGCGTLDNAVYWGTGPIAGSVAWTHAACAIDNTGHGSFDPGTPAPDGFFYFVIVGQNDSKEGSYGTGTAGERPEAIGIGICDRPQDFTGTCP